METTTPPNAWRWPSLRGRWVGISAALFLLNALWRGAVVNLDLRASGLHTPWLEPYVWELTSGFVVWALLPLVMAVVANAPWRRVPWARFAGLHLLGSLVFWVLHVAGLWACRIVIYRAVGWGNYNYGQVGYRVLMEGGKDVVAFFFLATIFHILALQRDRRAQELALARMESELREARLQALAAQLDPHFLFNALNTLSSVMYEDVAKADSLVSSLGLMLRDTLQAEGATWSLERELSHLSHYLAFVRARFGDRVTVAVEVAEGLGAIPVPRFALQRLVENALKHNEAEADRQLHIAVSARREGGALHLGVTDDGVGFASGEGQGVGLDNLRRSLALLHGERARLEVGNVPTGGARVELTVPQETARA